MDLKNKKVLVTGASSGLGLSVAKALLDKNAFVYLLGRSKSNLETAVKDFKTKDYELLVADVSDYDQLSKVLEGRDFDIVINNAGVWLEGQLIDNSIDQITSTLDINLKGTVFVTKLVLPQMQRKNQGIILNVSSTSGLGGKENQAVYCASKFGVRGFTDSLKLDLMKTNVKVLGFYPGGMNTPIFSKVGSSRKVDNWMDTDKVAKVVLTMLEQDDTMMIGNLELNRRTI